MPLIPRQERFCRAFVHYGIAAAAARDAGYSARSAKKQGWRLLRSPRIQARIREIQAELADHQERAQDAIVGKLEVVYQRALEDHQFYAAARAAQLQAQIMREPDTTKDPEMSTSGGPLSPGSQESSQRYALAEGNGGAGLRAVTAGG